MKSPFPGMDPYLESYWRDVHHRFCTYACDALQQQIRPALLARLEERLVVETDDHQRSIYPDVRIVQSNPTLFTAGSQSGVGVAEALEIEVGNDPAYEGFIQIIDPTSGGRLVTVIELLSISNKKSKVGIEQYRLKIAEAIEAGVSVVEIDLLRGGEWVLQLDESNVPIEKREPYRACVRLGYSPGKYRYYHFPLRERLLKLPIPLREGDAPALLDLQELIDRVYLNGAYDTIDYRLPPSPGFDENTEAWARGVLGARG